MTQVYNRDLFEPGHKISGPAIVEQLDTTTVIHQSKKRRWMAIGISSLKKKL
jgi:N-methylhydantoinase A/oxoprolinase/acetone carboxylase beta subunit